MYYAHCELYEWKSYFYYMVLYTSWVFIIVYMGVSENSVPLHPMVNDHYPY